MVDYSLRFSQQLVFWAVIVLGEAPIGRFRALDLRLSSNLILLAIGWLALVFGNVVSAVFRFSKFLRQFPRDD